VQSVEARQKSDQNYISHTASTETTPEFGKVFREVYIFISMAHYALKYYDLPGRGEPIRLIFALAKVPFDDVRIPLAEWQKWKPCKLPLDRLYNY
jgi:hypothetical protein